MILWIVLFFLVVAISFFLALSSMKDFSQNIKGKKQEYALFLIRTTQSLTPEFLENIHSRLLEKNALISFERLFKGGQSALTVYGPKDLLLLFREQLNLLELEDYADISLADAWEAGVKNLSVLEDRGIFDENFPVLNETEQIFMQLLLKCEKNEVFKGQIRIIVKCDDEIRRKNIVAKMQNLSPEVFFKLPKAFSSEQIITMYKERSFNDLRSQNLNIMEIVKLLKIA